MAQSLSQIYIHAVFGTKNRQNLIYESIEEEFHKYMTGIFKGINCPLLQINSMPDHTHIIFRISRQISISKVMEISKKESSKWFKTKGVSNFKWQAGYGAFSISYYNLDVALNYVKNQKEHHKRKSLQQEVTELMRTNNVEEFSEEFFWK